jgi:hypothetical protein
MDGMPRSLLGICLSVPSPHLRRGQARLAAHGRLQPRLELRARAVPVQATLPEHLAQLGHLRRQTDSSATCTEADAAAVRRAQPPAPSRCLDRQTQGGAGRLSVCGACPAAAGADRTDGQNPQRTARGQTDRADKTRAAPHAGTDRLDGQNPHRTARGDDGEHSSANMDERPDRQTDRQRDRQTDLVPNQPQCRFGRPAWSLPFGAWAFAIQQSVGPQNNTISKFQPENRIASAGSSEAATPGAPCPALDRPDYSALIRQSVWLAGHELMAPTPLHFRDLELLQMPAQTLCCAGLSVPSHEPTKPASTWRSLP